MGTRTARRTSQAQRGTGKNMKIKLRTGYFAKVTQYRLEGFIPVSIARWSPKWFSGPALPELAPSEDLLTRYKAGSVSEEEYTKEYEEQLQSINVFKSIQSLAKHITPETVGIVLCCYEKPGDFCHRHRLANELQEKYNVTIQEFSDEDIIRGDHRFDI